MSGCLWIGPDQDPRKGPVTYCGKPTLEGKHYCHEHYWRVYAKGTTINGRRKEKAIDAEIAELKRLEDLELELENEHD